MYYTRPSRLILSLVCLTGSLLAAESTTPNAAPLTPTEQVTQAAIKETAKELAAQAAPVTSQATELAKTGNEALRFILDKTKQYTGTAEHVIGQAVDVGMREAKPTIDEFLRWRLWKHGILFGLPVIIFIIMSIWLIIGYHRSDWDNGPTMGNVLTIFAGIVGFISALCIVGEIDDLLSFIQILVAPRIYLIEQISHLMGH